MGDNSSYAVLTDQITLATSYFRFRDIFLLYFCFKNGFAWNWLGILLEFDKLLLEDVTFVVFVWVLDRIFLDWFLKKIT